MMPFERTSTPALSSNDRRSLESPFEARALERPVSVTRRIAWRYAAPIVVVHALAVAVCLPWLFSWTGVVLLIVGVELYGGLGINIAYHRLLTHRSFKCPRWVERSLVVCALCCMEDAPASWVATHRMHHNDSDTRPDPHSPLVGFLWSHLGWLLVENHATRCLSAYDRYARDVLRDPFYLRLERSLLPIWIYLAHGLLYFGAGFLVGWLPQLDGYAGMQFGLSLFVWGVLARTVCVWHISWSVNSLTHLCGYRNHDTADNSRNSWLVALLSSGEGWHNNHHADPSSANNSNRWWELDPIYGFICALEMVGLASDVVPSRARRARQTILTLDAANPALPDNRQQRRAA